MIKKKLDIVTIFLVLNFNIVLQQQGGKRFSIFQHSPIVLISMAKKTIQDLLFEIFFCGERR